MKTFNFSLRAASAGLLITILVTGNLVAKERGWYYHGGINYWLSGVLRENTDWYETHLPGGKTSGWEWSDSKTTYIWGIGYKLNKNVRFEGAFLDFQKQELRGSHWLIPATEPGDEHISASWINRYKRSGAMLSVVYDFFLTEETSLFLELGKASTGRRTKIELVGPNTLVNVAVDSQTDELITLGSLLQQQIPGGASDLNDSSLIYSVGVRISVKNTKASFTIAYQFVQEDEGTGSNLELSLQWQH